MDESKNVLEFGKKVSNEENVQQDTPPEEEPKVEQEKPVKPEEKKGLTAKEIIEKLKAKNKYEEVLLPSRNLLYEEIGLQPDKPIHIRPMTIEEEKVLSTPRLVKSGQYIDRIFESCIYEDIPTQKLLSVDRIFILIYLRGISYGPEYEVQIKCPNCSSSFMEEISLNALNVEHAPDDFTGVFHVVLPNSKLNLWYRASRGEDERNLEKYMQVMNKNFKTDSSDALIKRHAMFINKIEDIVNKIEIEDIIRNLGVIDSNYLRSCMEDIGFGIDLDIGFTCERCFHEWDQGLPVDANFFFPRTKKA
ncbi:MAG: hypothetical protein ACOCV1_03650 [Bacillota bacterium]